MLRAFGLDNRLEAFSLRTWADKLAEPLALLGVAALLARVQPLAGLAPFALAFLAAGLARGAYPALLLAGCLTGTFHGGTVLPACPAGAGVVIAGVGTAALGTRWLQRRHGRASPDGIRIGDAALSIAAGLGVLVPGVPLAAGGARESLQVLGTAVAAAACAPFFRAVLGVRPARRHLMPEERAGAAILLCASLAGLAGLWMPAAMTAAFLSTLVAAPLGPGAAACTGVAAGTSLMLSGAEPARMAALGLCGLLCGMAAQQGRAFGWIASGPGRRCKRSSEERSSRFQEADFEKTAAGKTWSGALALAVGTPVAAVVMQLPPVDSLCALAACAAGLALPERWQGRLRGWLSGEARSACDPDRLAYQLRAETERKLRALSAAFGELAEGYRDPVDMPDEQTLICDMRARLCEGCSRYPACWAGDDNRAVRFLCQLISEAIEWSNGDRAESLFREEMPPDVLRQCVRGRSIPSRLGVLLEEFADKRRSELKRGAVSQLISAQFLQAQLLLGGMADVQARPLRVRGRQAARACAALDRAGIEVADVMALRGARRMEIVAVLKHGVWSAEQAACASGQLSRVFGRAYAPDSDPGTTEMKFVRLSRLRASASASSHSREAGTPSGDSHAIRMLDGDRLLLMLSDGMGSGEEAARESAQTLRLLDRFLAADVSRPLALETVNELMLARTQSDMFATVDLCVIDLTTGVAEFTKLAACRSLILRREEVIVVEGGQLPLGILERVQPSSAKVRLQPGDVVVMASDGVMEAAGFDAVCDCLEAHAHQPPEMLAETLLSLAEKTVDPKQRDDMTVLCARIIGRQAEPAPNCCRGGSAVPTANCCRA